MLSCHPYGPSVIENGENRGKTLQEYLDASGRKVLGQNCRRFRDFPILVKFIDARDNLSVQVHPANGYALQHEGEYGKTEMWYVLDAQPGSFLYYGFRKKISKSEFERRIKENTLLDVLNAVPVKKGDTFFIPSGTIHAIGKGILIAEIQQNSNITYRVYDYGRIDKNGKQRELNIDKAVAVTKRGPVEIQGTSRPHLADCDYFTVDKVNLDGTMTSRIEGIVTESSFLSILILDGVGTISCHGDQLIYKKGDSFFIPAGSGNWRIEGKCEALLTTIRKKENPIRIGIMIGSRITRIGIVDENNRIIASTEFPTGKLPSDKVIGNVTRRTLALLKAKKIPLDQCVEAGIGVPGTIDRKEGNVIYSNNLHWKNVPIIKEIGRLLPFPVYIANNADCAAMGEAVAGAGRAYKNIAMLTLGNGVGGGIILNGILFGGGMTGGGELGHQVIVANGRKCTCGRRGCLEAYVSVPALIKSAHRHGLMHVDAVNIFTAASNGDPEARDVIQSYEGNLSTGIINIVNMFRPNLIIIGGEISPYVSDILPYLKEAVEKNIFGGNLGTCPEIKAAQLGTQAGIIGAANL